MTERAFHESETPNEFEQPWLQCLGPGDEVIVQEHGRDTQAWVAQRLQSGRLLVTWNGNTCEFNADGRLRTSGTYTSTFLVEPTAYRRGMLEKQYLARYLAAQQWHHVPLDTLRQIAALVQGD